MRLALLKLRARGRLHAGAGVRVGPGVRIAVGPNARVELGDGASLGAGARIEAVAGTVRVGPGARLGERAVIVSLAGVEIGPRAVLGDWAMIADAEPAWADPEAPVRRQPLNRAPVRVEADARLGPHAAVLAGATIPAGAEVAPYEVAGGNFPSPHGDRRLRGRR